MFTNQNDYLKYIPKYIQNNSVVITPESLNQDYLLHLSNIQHIDNILIPNVSRRAAMTEDNTLARVHTSPHILGCLYGIATTHLNVINNYVDPKTKKTAFKNGYYIYKVPFEYALRPNKKLIFDVDWSYETWLTRYENVDDYKAELIGYLVITHVSVIPTDSTPLFVIKFILHTDSNIKIDTDKEIEKGNVEFEFVNGVTKTIDVNKIDQSYYEEAKQLNASMLSLDNVPFFKGL